MWLASLVTNCRWIRKHIGALFGLMLTVYVLSYAKVRLCVCLKLALLLLLSRSRNVVVWCGERPLQEESVHLFWCLMSLSRKWKLYSVCPMYQFLSKYYFSTQAVGSASFFDSPEAQKPLAEFDILCCKVSVHVACGPSPGSAGSLHRLGCSCHF